MIHWFDLDKTIWESFDRFNNPIWAKQLILPLTLVKPDLIKDDVGSTCRLKPGIRMYLAFLKKKRTKIGLISIGRHWDLPDSYQPSFLLLKKFKIETFFNYKKILVYKKNKKSKFINSSTPFIFYDDDEKHHKDILKKFPNAKIVDAKNIKDFSYFIKKK